MVKVNNGKYDVFVIANDEYIGPCIARGYEWDAWMRMDVEKHYKPGTDIIDMGANIGYNTLIFPNMVRYIHLNPCIIQSWTKMLK